MKGFKEKAGVTWQDVQEAIEDLEEEFQCSLEIHMRARRVPGAPKGRLGVKGVAIGGLLSAGLSWRREYSLDWPTYGTRTMAGLYLRLVYEMRESLVERPPKPGKAWKSILAPLA